MSRNKSAIQLYSDQMFEIKQRMKVIDFYLSENDYAVYKATTTETICLQFRKILELIAFSSLIANKTQYSAVHTNFESHWNAELLLKDLARINPRFYPQPVKEEPSQTLGVKNLLVDITDGYLSKEEFVHVYKRCGGMLHAINPYGSKTGYHYFNKSFSEWREKLILLLNCHLVQLIGQDVFWLIHMHEKGDELVHSYEFAPADDIQPSRVGS